MKRKLSLLLCLIAVISLLLSSCDFLSEFKPDEESGDQNPPSDNGIISLDDIPAFDGETPYVSINGNIPFFEDERCDESYEIYSELDSLGRCGVALACLGPDLMPSEDREEIGHVKPSGWHSVKYDVVPGKNLYNRCHLIGFQLAGENDNEKNLITGTRNMNNEGMLPFENMLADYIKETGNHVLYRVSPIYDGYDLVARGVLMEAKSVEDDEICFCIYVYNCQPGVVIDYKTGESRLADDPLGSFVNSNHDKLDIIPAAAADTVTDMYVETVDGEYSGCLVIMKVNGHISSITLAVDVSEEERIVAVSVIKHSESHGHKDEVDAFVDSFVGKDAEGASGVELVSGATVTTSAMREGIADAIEAAAAYENATENGEVYVVNVSSKRFHLESCSGATSMSEANKLVYIGFAADLLEAGYIACGTCDPAEAQP